MNPFIFLFFVVAVDMGMTHIGLVRLRKYVKDFYNMELNPVIRYLYRTFTPVIAAIIGSIYTLCLIGIMFWLLREHEQLIFIISGVYFLLLLIHVHSAKYIDTFIAYRRIMKEEGIEVLKYD